MKESIIITYHKNKDMLLYCLDRILKTTPNEVEILIIGNNINKSELDIDIPNSRCKYLKDCACLFSKRNTDITSNIAKA